MPWYGRALTVLMLAVALTGCEGRVSTLDATSTAAGGSVYPIDAAQADRVLAEAMTETFPGSPLAPVSLPGKGYSATIRFALDAHQITAMAVPTEGRAAGGAAVAGYSFEIVHSGTLPITASRRTAALLAAIRRRAGAIAPPLPAL